MKKNLFSFPGILLQLFAACLLFYSFFSFSQVDRGLPSNSTQLGSLLFNDPILSGDRTISCASCHKAQFAFADSSSFSRGVNGHFTSRNTPTAMYQESKTVFFWDGRASSLEQQARGPITNPSEMNLPLAEAVVRVNNNGFYPGAFKKIFGRVADSVSLLKCIADFEKSLSTYDAPYDRFLKGNDTAMSESATRGFTIFLRRNSCGNSACHAGLSFSSDSLVNIGVYTDADRGVYELTHDPKDIGKFKSPSLRNIALTAPYMHNGVHKTLREVINYYNDPKNFPLDGNTHEDVKRQRERPLTEDEINDLIEFMKALTDYRFMTAANKN